MSDHQNCSHPPDRSVPFHPFIMQWQQRLTYLQLVASHTGLDSKSLVICEKPFMSFYWAVQQGQSPQISPTHLGGYWSRLFAITLDDRAKKNIDCQILADQQTPSHNDDSNQSLGWPHVKDALVRTQPQGASSKELVPFPRARLTSGTDLLAAGLCGTVKSLAYRLLKPQARAVRQRLADLTLQPAEDGFRPSLNSLFSARYLQSHLIFARQAGVSVAIAHLGMAIDPRPLCADKLLRNSIKDLFLLVVMTIDMAEEIFMDLGRLFKAIQQKTAELLAASPGLSLEKVWLNYRLGERENGDRWLVFLATTIQIFHPQSAKVFPVSYMEAIDTYFPRLSSFKLNAAKINTTNARFPAPCLLIYILQHQHSLSLGYVDSSTDADQLHQLWQLVLKGVAILSSADAAYSISEDA